MPTALLALLAAQALAAPVELRVNDALVKDKPLPGVAVAVTGADGAEVARGETGPDGALRVEVPPGSWYGTYTLAGYVPVARSPFVVDDGGTVVTTSLLMMLESGGTPERKVRIVLNWGSDEANHVRDADAHLLFGPHDAEVYFGNKSIANEHGQVQLDVDDLDWGGPETITLIEPAPGQFKWFVRNYSGPPAALGTSEVVVRAFAGDAQLGEWRPPADVVEQDWYPFRAVEVGPDLVARVVPWTPEELAARADRRTSPTYGAGCCSTTGLAIFGLGSFLPVLALGRRRWRRR